jgi:hypothetical protein
MVKRQLRQLIIADALLLGQRVSKSLNFDENVCGDKTSLTSQIRVRSHIMNITSKWPSISKIIRNLVIPIIAITLICSFCSASPPLSIGKDGEISIHGDPTIPFGLYHVSWIEDSLGRPRMGDSLLTDIGIIGALKFPLMQYNIEASPLATKQLSKAASLGIVVIGELEYGWWKDGPARHRALTAQAAINPSDIGAWNIGDDINWRDPKRGLPLEPEALRARSKLMKQLVPNTLTYASGVALDAEHGGTIRSMGDYRGAADILGFTSYTLGEDTGIDESLALEQTVRNFRAVEDAFSGSDQALFAILQLFSFSTGPKPTISEVRSWAYSAIMHGFDGIMGYGFYAEGSHYPTYLPDTDPQLLRDVATLSHEIAALLPWIRDSQRHHLSLSGTTSVHATEWNRHGSRLIIFLNSDRTKSADISLAEIFSSQTWSELSPDSEGSLSLTQKNLETVSRKTSPIKLGPAAVRIFTNEERQFTH